MLSQLYDISFYIAFEMQKKPNPVLAKLSEKAKELINKKLLPKLPRFGKLTPENGNPCIAKLHKTLEDFRFEDQCIKARIRDTGGIENFAYQDLGKSVIGQYRLTFEILNKHEGSQAENYGHVLPILLKKIMKIKVQTDQAVIQITDYRTHGQIKTNDSHWPKNASTEF